MSSPEPKKRGRKKKQNNDEENKEEVPTPPQKILNKRGRKARVVDFKKNQEAKLVNFNMEETYILHLPISIDELLKDIPIQLGIENILMQKPVLPVPYNSNNFIYYNKEKNIINTDNNKHKDIVKEEKVQIYKCTDKRGNSEVIKIYDEPILPTTDLDYENIKRITVSKTNIACWWCCYQFDTYPVCCPVKYNEKKDIFTVIGCFCSFNCAKSYSTTEYNSKYSNISFLYRKIMSQFKSIKPAPPRTVLKMFGGPITIEEYRDTFDTLSSISINKYPMVFMPTQIEYHKVTELIKNSLDRNSISKSNKNNEGIVTKKNISDASKRLSISKDNQKSNNNLMNIMGIKVKN